MVSWLVPFRIDHCDWPESYFSYTSFITKNLYQSLRKFIPGIQRLGTGVLFIFELPRSQGGILRRGYRAPSSTHTGCYRTDHELRERNNFSLKVCTVTTSTLAVLTKVTAGTFFFPSRSAILGRYQAITALHRIRVEHPWCCFQLWRQSVWRSLPSRCRLGSVRPQVAQRCWKG